MNIQNNDNEEGLIKIEDQNRDSNTLQNISQENDSLKKTIREL